MAYHHVSLIDRYLHDKLHSNWKKTDVQMGGQTLTFGGVNLTTVSLENLKQDSGSL